jgi:hypothetical protein
MPSDWGRKDENIEAILRCRGRLWILRGTRFSEQSRSRRFKAGLVGRIDEFTGLGMELEEILRDD